MSDDFFMKDPTLDILTVELPFSIQCLGWP